MTNNEGLTSNPYFSFLAEREKSRHQDNLKWREEVWGRLIQAISLITSQYPKITSISLFGSLMGDDFNRDSDVDLYIEELSAEEYFDVKRAFENMLDLDIDLYTQGDQRQFVERIKERGVTVYERKIGIINCQY